MKRPPNDVERMIMRRASYQTFELCYTLMIAALFLVDGLLYAGFIASFWLQFAFGVFSFGLSGMSVSIFVVILIDGYYTERENLYMIPREVNASKKEVHP